MTSRYASAFRFDFRVLIGVAVLCTAMPAGAAPYYVPINPTMSDKTVTLNGHTLTIDQIFDLLRRPFGETDPAYLAALLGVREDRERLRVGCPAIANARLQPRDRFEVVVQHVGP